MPRFVDDREAVFLVAKGQTIACFSGQSHQDGSYSIEPVLNTDDDVEPTIELVYDSKERADAAIEEMFALTGSCLCSACDAIRAEALEQG